MESSQKQRHYLSPVTFGGVALLLSKNGCQDRTINTSYAETMQRASNAIQITTITTPAIRLTGFPFLKVSWACAWQSANTESGTNLIANAAIVESRSEHPLILAGKQLGPWVTELRTACERGQSGAWRPRTRHRFEGPNGDQPRSRERAASVDERTGQIPLSLPNTPCGNSPAEKQTVRRQK